MILATLCYLKDRSKTLMLHRNKREGDKHRGKWNGLGGKLQPGESPEECALREVYEESNLRVSVLQFNGVITFPKFDGVNDWYVFVYSGRSEPGDLVEGDEGTLHWIENSKLLELNLWEGDRLFLPQVLEGKLFSAKIIYKEGRFVDGSVVTYGLAAEAVPAPLLHSYP